MELRNLCHSHFIQKVSADGVKEVMNVSCGRPELVFKKVTDIYGFQDVFLLNKPSRRCHGDDAQHKVFDSEKIKAIVPYSSMGTDQVPDPNEDRVSSERGADLNGSISGSMTLNQIKTACKLKKRKRSIPGKETQRDDFDLKETLCMWKFKLKKNDKGKKKRVNKYASSYQNPVVAFKSERTFVDHHVPGYDLEMPMPLAIEFDDPNYNHSDYQTAVSVVGDSSFLESEPLFSHFLEYESVSKQSDECVLDSESSPEDRINDVLTPASVLAASATDSSERNQGSLQAEELELECIINTATQEIPTNDSFENGSHNRNYSTDFDAQTTVSIVSEPCTQGSPKYADERVKAADANTENSLGDYNGQLTSPKRVEYSRFLNVQQSSRRLFTTRKVISPTSQEWLCKALRSNEESDEEYLYRCKGVYLKKQRESKFARATKNEKQESHNSTGSCSENAVAEHKKDELNGIPNYLSTQIHTKKCSPPKTAANPPQISSMSCNTTRSCSENAVVFSQRQLQDIENLATKLIGELKTMKVIAEEAWCLDVCTNPDEVRMRIENATKAEETARKWLSIMSRDCNRFCKIIKISENSRPAVPPTPVAVHNGKRKISFADEAGKELCHVRYFYG